MAQLTLLSQEALITRLSSKKRTWLVTGGAGFIGSHIIEELLLHGQNVRILDNFSSGKKANLETVKNNVGVELWKNFELVTGDIRDFETCVKATIGVQFVLHHAAMGSVPASVVDPQTCHDINTSGTLHMLKACQQNNTERFMFASSAAIYGDEPTSPKHEKMNACVLSPYAASKMANELYAHSFFKSYGMQCVGFRYFNVFGARQDPNGSYASVIPRWIQFLKESKTIPIFGDGLQTRDFCHVSQIVQMNIRAALAEGTHFVGEVFNVGLGQSTSLLELLKLIIEQVKIETGGSISEPKLSYEKTRLGDVKHSKAAIDKSIELLGFAPTVSVQEGLARTVSWYLNAKETT
ncbi:MAG: NAD-dependent epimerase/dehydratase family protein [Bdellovibrionaceae bacterium]|nr:NAD-dependent epimerase/dehydratase family protein [Pseudobdellovibrionaceae bacterium]